MKTVELTMDEQVMLMSCLLLVNHYHKPFIRNPEFRKDIKKRIRLRRKMANLYNVRGEQYK